MSVCVCVCVRERKKDLLFFLSQHYQKEADGLCCRLRYYVEKTGSHDFVVDIEEFKRRQFVMFMTLVTDP